MFIQGSKLRQKKLLCEITCTMTSELHDFIAITKAIIIFVGSWSDYDLVKEKPEKQTEHFPPNRTLKISLLY